MIALRPRHVVPMLLGLLLSACAAPEPDSSPAKSPTDQPAEDPGNGPPWLEPATPSNLDFVHWNGMVGEHHFHEILPPGGAVIDFDNDGDLDLFFVQSAVADPTREPLEPFPGPGEPTDRLYRNDLDPAGALSFTDVTAEIGLESHGYGMGVAAGDIDNDGWTDLYVTRFGDNQLWRNTGADGQLGFEDVTAVAGVTETRWSTSAAFADFDRDGWLDLFVVNYVDARLANHENCFNEAGGREYCGPSSFEPVTDRLWRNLGPDADGQIRFEDISGTAGLLASPGPGLGVAISDLDGDGWLDAYVANDQAANFLWRNRGSWPDAPLFVDEAILRGAAFDNAGRAQASMGVLAADLDADGDEDLFMTHLLRELNTLYRNDGRGLFNDHSRASGLGNASIGSTGFGAVAFDLDNDGWLDLLTVNGEVRTIAEQRSAGEKLPLRQPDQLFLNRGGVFVEAGERAPVLAEAMVSRGATIGDLDNDGDSDVLIHQTNAPPRLLINQVGQISGWIGLRLLDVAGRDALGAKVEVIAARERESAGEPATRTRLARADGSFLSSHDPRVLIGLGEVAEGATVDVRITWPTGEAETRKTLSVRRYHELRQGGDSP